MAKAKKELRDVVYSFIAKETKKTESIKRMAETQEAAARLKQEK